MRDEAGKDRTLVVNAGGNFDPALEGASAENEFILSALAASGVDVIGVAPDDLKKPGAEALRRFKKIPVVSANVPGFKRFVRIPKSGGRRSLIVTSAMDPALAASVQSSIGAIEDPVKAINGIERNNGEDLLVVITYADKAYQDKLIEDCRGIDLVVDGLASSDVPAFHVTDSLPVVSNNNQGMFVAYIDYQGGSEINAFSSPQYLRATVGEIKQDPQIKDLFDKWMKQKQANYLEQQGEAERRTAGGFPGGESAYAGTGSCKDCHYEINRSWASSRHAQAYSSLKERQREFDQDCLSCHVTGMKQLDGSEADPEATENSWMAGVHCEACHGPAAHHARDPKDSKMPAVTQNTCTSCHTRKKDPAFDYSRDVHKVNHRNSRIGLKSK